MFFKLTFYLFIYENPWCYQLIWNYYNKLQLQGNMIKPHMIDK